MSYCAICDPDDAPTLDTETREGWLDLLSHAVDDHPSELNELIDGEVLLVACTECEDSFYDEPKVMSHPMEDNHIRVDAFCESCSDEQPYAALISQKIDVSVLYDQIIDGVDVEGEDGYTAVEPITQATTPRAIVEYYCKYDEYDEDEWVQWNVKSIGTSLKASDANVTRRIIGFCETPKGTMMPRMDSDSDSISEFKSEVEAKATYVHWK